MGSAMEGTLWKHVQDAPFTSKSSWLLHHEGLSMRRMLPSRIRDQSSHKGHVACVVPRGCS